MIDVYKIEKIVNNQTLSEVYKRYTGKTLDDAHDAMSDTKATFEILRHQIDTFDLPTTVKELDEFTQKGQKRADLSNRLFFDETGNLCWNFGKHKGKRVSLYPDYAKWFLTTDLAYDTRTLIEKELKK